MADVRDLEIRHLTALVAVVDEGSFGAAAAALGFTQSAVSQQIAALEKAVGMPVFDRPKGPRRAELTPAGELLAARARALLGDVADLADDLDRLRRGLTGRLVVGTFQSVSAEVLPPLIGRFRAEVPDVEIRLYENDDQGDQLDRLLADDLDLAFTVDPPDDPRLDTLLLGHDPFVVIAAPADAPGPAATPADLESGPLIGQPLGDVCQALIDERLLSVGIRPDYVFRSRDNGAVQGMVRSGMGRAIMPRLAVDADDPGVVVLPLDPPIRPRDIHLTRRRGRSLPPAVDRFTELAVEIADELLLERPADAVT